MKQLSLLLFLVFTTSVFSQNLKLGPAVDFPEGGDPYFGGKLGFEDQLGEHFSFEANVSYTGRNDQLIVSNQGTTATVDASQALFQIKGQGNYYFSPLSDGFHTGLALGYANISANVDAEVDGTPVIQNGRGNEGQFIAELPVGYSFDLSDQFNLDFVTGVGCYACLSTDPFAIFPFHANVVYELN